VPLNGPPPRRRPRAYVVDDEAPALARMRALLEASGRVDLVGASDDPFAARRALATDPVDVVFLDVEMPEMNGFALLAGLAPAPAVVFTTAHDAYAVRAFGVDALDYLLKPVARPALDRTLAKLERSLAPHPAPPPPDPGALAARLERLERNLEALAGARPAARLASRVGGRVRLLEPAEVSHVYAEDKLSYAVVAGEPFVVDHSIRDLEARLDPASFVRIHRATLVNLDHVAELRFGAGGTWVRLRGPPPADLPVARDRVAALRDRLRLPERP
jgi:two-component system LytT family response regulator